MICAYFKVFLGHKVPNLVIIIIQTPTIYLFTCSKKKQLHTMYLCSSGGIHRNSSLISVEITHV